MNLGVYCETLSPEQLGKKAVLDLLGWHGVTLAHAVRFESLGGTGDAEAVVPHLRLAERVRAAGGRYALWPLLPKQLGYWINERNLDATAWMMEELCAAFRRHGIAPDAIVFDIETPWSQMEQVFFPGPPWWRRLLSLARMALENRNPRRFAWSMRRLESIVDAVRAEGMLVSCAVFPFLIADLIANGRVFQDYLEMPVFDLPFDGFNAMFYNSYLPHAAPLVVPPAGAQRFLFEYAHELAARYAQRAWVTLGSTWEGVLPGNEGNIYRAASELVPDVAAARAAGIETVWLYCLEGVLFSDRALTQQRPAAAANAFFEVLADTPVQEPSPHEGWSRGRRLLELVARDHWRG